MATQTLLSRRDKTKFPPIHVTVGNRAETRGTRRTGRGGTGRTIETTPPQRSPFGVKLQKDGLFADAEERLLAAAIAQHPQCAAALDELLDDLDWIEPRADGEVRRMLPSGDVARQQRMEDLLLEAILRTHPNRDAALDRLFADACGDAALDCCCDETEERAQFDAAIDNDFDGMA